MKIKTDSMSQTRPAWLDRVFKVEMTGEELLRLWKLSRSRSCEGGFPYPITPSGGRYKRFHLDVSNALSINPGTLEELARTMRAGEID